jgi:guanylate kinase
MNYTLTQHFPFRGQRFLLEEEEVVLIKPVLFVLSAPSGSGKSTLINRVRSIVPDLFYSVSCTTRAPRPGEVDSVDYFFLDPRDFEEMIRNGGFLEWKEVHGSRYGTPSQPILDALAKGRRCVMDIDVQGAADVFERIKESVGVFIMPPGLDVLEKRLRRRGSDSEDSIKTRLKNAQEELKSAGLFPYKIVNDDLERATLELVSIILKESGNSNER